MEIARFKTRTNITGLQLEKRFQLMELTQTMKGARKSLPDNIHWHLKREKEPGVCEVTWILKTGEIIIDCKENRYGWWMDETASSLRKEFSKG